MKKLVLLVLALTLVSAGSAMALPSLSSVPGASKVTNSPAGKVATEATKLGVVAAVNADLEKKAAACKCDTKTGTLTGCDLKSIKRTVNNSQSGIKAALGSTVNFNVDAGAQACATEIQNEVTGWWYWHTNVKKKLGSSVKMWLN